MMTVNEVSRLAGVSVRTLHHYDRIGLLPASRISEAGYRLYDDAALERLQQILLYRELEFPLKDIGRILDSPSFDRDTALSQQIRLLELRREHIEELIALAREIKTTGVKTMSFKEFSKEKIDEYAAKAKESWGGTAEYKEFERKSAARSEADNKSLGDRMMDFFASFGRIKSASPESTEAKALAVKLQKFICENYYECSDELFARLADMYCAGGEMTENIDAAGGEGTAEFAGAAIKSMLADKLK